MSSGFLYPRVTWQQTLAASIDLAGSPALAVAPNDTVYFAVSAKGVFASLPSVSTYQIVIGAVDKDGSLLWTYRPPQLVSTVADTQPTLHIGPTGELYVAFVTTGAVPGKINQYNVVSFCGSCGTTSGLEDFVVARINGAASGTPSIAWVLQDATIDSCSRETRPRLALDAARGYLLIAGLSTGATLCNVAVGSPNLVISALSMTTGGLVWAYQSDEINCTGQNGSPSITVDAAGNIYVAYTITTSVMGGQYQGGTSDVEVIRFHTEGSPINIVRDWILSASTIVNSTLADTDPTIVCDSSRNTLYLAFATTGVVPGGTKTSTGSDIVFASINATTGSLNWLREDPYYNQVYYRYSSADSPVLALDVNGALYMAAHAIDAATSNGMILMFRLNPDTGDSAWFYNLGATVYRAYLPAINGGGPQTVFSGPSPYSAPWVAIGGGNLYVGFNKQDSITFELLGLRQIQRYEDITAFEYMNEYTGICG